MRKKSTSRIVTLGSKETFVFQGGVIEGFNFAITHVEEDVDLQKIGIEVFLHRHGRKITLAKTNLHNATLISCVTGTQSALYNFKDSVAIGFESDGTTANKWLSGGWLRLNPVDINKSKITVEVDFNRQAISSSDHSYNFIAVTDLESVERERKLSQIMQRYIDQDETNIVFKSNDVKTVLYNGGTNVASRGIAHANADNVPLRSVNYMVDGRMRTKNYTDLLVDRIYHNDLAPSASYIQWLYFVSSSFRKRLDLEIILNVGKMDVGDTYLIWEKII